MAKLGRINRNKRVTEYSEACAEKRSELAKKLKSSSFEEKFHAMIAFQKLSRDGSHVRVRSRCEICGRSRSYIGKFDMCRCCVRKYASNCLISGLVKSSW